MYAIFAVFSNSTWELKDIGLFDPGRMKVVKDAGYLYPDIEFRASFSLCLSLRFLLLVKNQVLYICKHYYTI